MQQSNVSHEQPFMRERALALVCLMLLSLLSTSAAIPDEIKISNLAQWNRLSSSIC